MWFQEGKSRPPKKKVTPGGVQSVGVKSVTPPTVRSTLRSPDDGRAATFRDSVVSATGTTWHKAQSLVCPA